MRAHYRIGSLIVLALLVEGSPVVARPLVVLEHRIVGARLEVSPTELFVPKNIPGSLSVRLETGGRPGASKLSHGTHVEGVLRGPAFPAYRLLGLPNEPLILPPIALTGDYQIDDLRLVDTRTGEVLLMATPSQVAVHVFSEVLVSQVQSRPLSLAEIEQRAIVINPDSFSALEFEALFLLQGVPFPVRFPVVTPKFKESTEIIPSASCERGLRKLSASTRTSPGP